MWCRFDVFTAIFHLQAAALDLVLSPAEVAELDRLHCDLRVTWDPAGVP